MATLLGNSRVSAHPQLTPRRGSQRRSETTIFTAESATNGFLRYRFEPVVEELAELHDQAIIEAEFFQSLLFLSQAYGFGFDVTAMENTSVYPHNVFLAFSQAEAALQAADPNASLAIIEDDDTLRSTLAVYKVYETGFTSYFIPLEPLYQTLKGKSRLSASALLCSLVSYLHTVAGVAFFSDESSFVYYQCDMMAESMREDDEENQLAEFETLLTDTRLGGSILQRYIGWNQRHLDAFETRHQSFRPTDEWEEALHRISGSFLSLYRQYPDRTYTEAMSGDWTIPTMIIPLTPTSELVFYGNGGIGSMITYWNRWTAILTGAGTLKNHWRIICLTGLAPNHRFV
ncbi:MAG: hypothetical protein EOO39_14395 [Cytophagaceae bacterium]|nr:MAG: hypothetical protein EOO39_14395 [Cytophagaceae bacterium]